MNVLYRIIVDELNIRKGTDKLINFFKFNEEDKNIKNKEWYSKL